MGTPLAAHRSGAQYPLTPVPLTRIEIGPPISAASARQWHSPITFHEVRPGGHNITALAAIQLGGRAFVHEPGAYVSAVRFVRLTNPVFTEPKPSGYSWLVIYDHDYPGGASCPSTGCPTPTPGPPPRSYRSIVVVDARSGTPLLKFTVPKP